MDQQINPLHYDDHPVPISIPTELNFVDVRNIAKERQIDSEDLQEYFEPLIFNNTESNACENVIESEINLHGHTQLRDRVTCTPIYPNSVFICGANKIFEYNKDDKKVSRVKLITNCPFPDFLLLTQ